MTGIAIWFISNSFHPHIGGSERQAQALAAQFASLSLPVTALARWHNLQYPYCPPPTELIGGVRILRAWSYGSGAFAALAFIFSGLLTVRRYLRVGQRLVFYAQDIGAPAILALIASRLFGGVCVVKVRGGQLDYHFYARSWTHRALLTLLSRWADAFVIVNRALFNVTDEWGVPRHRVHYIPNGIDTTRYAPAEAHTRNRLRDELRLPTAKVVILYCGRLEYVKGVDLLLNAWALLAKDVRNRAFLCIVGDGNERTQLLKQATAVKARDGIYFAGRHEDPLDYYRAADVFVLPSRSEGLSNALLEALACGLIGVVSNVGGAAELARLGLPVRLFTSGRPDHLAEALREVILGWPLGAVRSQPAAIQEFSLNVIAKKHLKLYTQLTDIET